MVTSSARARAPPVARKAVSVVLCPSRTAPGWAKNWSPERGVTENPAWTPEAITKAVPPRWASTACWGSSPVPMVTAPAGAAVASSGGATTGGAETGGTDGGGVPAPGTVVGGDVTPWLFDVVLRATRMPTTAATTTTASAATTHGQRRRRRAGPPGDPARRPVVLTVAFSSHGRTVSGLIAPRSSGRTSDVGGEGGRAGPGQGVGGLGVPPVEEPGQR